MIHTFDFEQRTPEWEDARRGMVTASVVGRLVSVEPADPISTDCPTCHAVAGEQCWSVARKAPTTIKTAHDARVLAAATLPPVYRTAKSDTAKVVREVLVAERINGWSEPIRATFDMMRGVLDEPAARKVYAQHFGTVTEVGLIVRDDWGFSIGYSPDGLVGDDGLIEVKSRRARLQLSTVLADEVPAENMAQIQAGLLVSGRRWCDYVSFSGGMKLWRKRVYPDPDWQGAIIAAVRAFEADAAEMVATYTERTAGLPATERSLYDMEIE